MYTEVSILLKIFTYMIFITTMFLKNKAELCVAIQLSYRDRFLTILNLSDFYLLGVGVNFSVSTPGQINLVVNGKYHIAAEMCPITSIYNMP